MAASSQVRSIGLALSRIRLTVVMCCWIVGLALALQTLVWSLATYTDLRFEPADTVLAEDTESIVAAESPRQQQIRHAREAEMGIALTSTDEDTDEARTLGWYDELFALSTTIAGGAGRCAMLVVLAMMMVGVVLSAGSATPGVERVVSSLVWALIVAILVLPLGQAFSMPWQHGALTSYEHMIGWVDHMESQRTSGTSPDTMTTLMFFGRLGLLPATCIVGITLVGLRFSAGVEAGVVSGESMRLDPALERETANINPSSLHAGRSAGALGQTLRGTGEGDRSQPMATQLSPGDAPKRLI